MARLAAKELSTAFGQAVVVENRPGTLALAGTELAAKAAALTASSGQLGSLAARADALGALERLSKRGIQKIVSAGVAMDLAERRKLPLSGAASADDEPPVTEESMTSGVMLRRTRQREPLSHRSALLTLTRSRPTGFASSGALCWVPGA